MCFSNILKVKKIIGDTAEVDDNRLVRLGNVVGIAPGDYIEVYADIALGKIDEMDARDIYQMRKGD